VQAIRASQAEQAPSNKTHARPPLNCTTDKALITAARQVARMNWLPQLPLTWIPVLHWLSFSFFFLFCR
jgi:hypothetical protein